MISALFVENGGCYWSAEGVDPWDIKRDARRYDGLNPVVAHPPCERWGRFAGGSPTKRGYSVGEDGGCFASALESVRRCGGVLEHPAHSKAWAEFGLLAPPNGGGWMRNGERNEWTCHVEQGHYGHGARKATWLLYVGEFEPPPLIWGKSPQKLPAKRLAERGYESARRAGAVANMSHKQRQRTPVAFRDLLISLALHSKSKGKS